MKMNIEIDGEDVYFKDEEDPDHYYFEIPLKQICKTKIMNFKLHSYWIEKYYKTIFFDYNSIYVFVEFINKEFPNNNINWYSQLYNIEYYQELIEMQTYLNENLARYLLNAKKRDLDWSATELANDKIKLTKIEIKVLTQLIKYNLFINKQTILL